MKQVFQNLKTDCTKVAGIPGLFGALVRQPVSLVRQMERLDLSDQRFLPNAMMLTISFHPITAGMRVEEK
jgi:hypothetical protein